MAVIRGLYPPPGMLRSLHGGQSERKVNTENSKMREERCRKLIHGESSLPVGAHEVSAHIMEGASVESPEMGYLYFFYMQ